MNSLENSGMTSFRTADFQDNNNNGMDDRDERSNRQQSPQYQEDSNNLYRGNMNFDSIMSGIYGYQPGEDDDEGRAIKNAFGYDMASKYFDSNLAIGMAEMQSGISQDNMTHASNLSQQEQSNSRYEEFNYGMHALDKQYEVSNQFANQNYGRDIGYLGASGEQTRKNMQAEGQQNRLQSITDGEQQRLGIAATGDQYRRGLRVEGDETRKGYRVQGDEARKGYRVQGDETRKTDTNRIDTQGVNDRKGYRVQGDETRKTDTNRITTEGNEERSTLTHEDKLTAGKAKRHNARARATARSF